MLFRSPEGSTPPVREGHEAYQGECASYNNWAYEVETGKVIIETIEKRGIKAIEVPGIIVASHGPFTWGKTPEEAVHNAVVLEEVAKMAYYTKSINPGVKQADKYLQDKHYLRKHGANAYYGQK